jgi:hypothetical protein
VKPGVNKIDAEGPPLGIGIPTYNRASMLKRTIDAVRQHTFTPFNLVVADDGSSDETEALLMAEENVSRIRGRNMGACWNKNRLLFFLTNVLMCHTVLLLEDDCCPTEGGWELDWMYAVRRYGHVNFAGNWFDRYFLGGSGLPHDPIKSKVISGQCVGFSRLAVQRIGYFDTRYRGYGIGHVEHSWRMAQGGFGGQVDPDDPEHPTYFLLRSQISVENDPSNRDDVSIARNQTLFCETRREGTHRWAWRSDDEMRQFLGEIDQASTSVKEVSAPRPGRHGPCDSGAWSGSGRVGIALSAGGGGTVLPLIERIIQLTESANSLIVCDHGLETSTREALQEVCLRVIGGSRQEYAWNKNLALFYLLHVCKCEVVILMDDCVWPIVHGWDLAWADAARRHGHVNFFPSDQKDKLYGGRLVAEQPGVGPLVGGMIMAQTAAAAALVGYMDPRFGLDPRAHVDYSLRFLRAGYGGFRYHREERTQDLFYLIGGGVVLRGNPCITSRTAYSPQAPLEEQPIFRLPWTTDAEAAEFRNEIAGDSGVTPLAGGFWAQDYFASNPDVARAGEDPLRHYLTHGINEGRPLGRGV